MKFRLKNKDGFTLVELIIVIGIIAIMSAVVIPSIGKITRDKQVNHANYNAQLVFMELQKYVNTFDYTNSSEILYSAHGKYDDIYSTVTEQISASSGNIDIEPQLTLSDEVEKSIWYAEIDNKTKTVKYVVWVEDYNVSYSTISGVTNVSQQKAYNSTVSSKKQIVGLYPRGT